MLEPLENMPEIAKPKSAGDITQFLNLTEHKIKLDAKVLEMKLFEEVK